METIRNQLKTLYFSAQEPQVASAKKRPTDKPVWQWHPWSGFCHIQRRRKVPGSQGQGSRQETRDTWKELTFGALWSRKIHNSPLRQRRWHPLQCAGPPGYSSKRVCWRSVQTGCHKFPHSATVTIKKEQENTSLALLGALIRETEVDIIVLIVLCN